MSFQTTRVDTRDVFKIFFRFSKVAQTVHNFVESFLDHEFLCRTRLGKMSLHLVLLIRLQGWGPHRSASAASVQVAILIPRIRLNSCFQGHSFPVNYFVFSVNYLITFVN